MKDAFRAREMDEGRQTKGLLVVYEFWSCGMFSKNASCNVSKNCIPEHLCIEVLQGNRKFACSFYDYFAECKTEV